MQAVFQFTKVAGLEGVNRVESFWDPGGERLMSPKATTRRVACDNVAGSEDVESSVAVTLADRPSRSLRRAVVDVVEHERSNPARSRPFAEAQRRELAGSLLDRATDIAASLKRTGRSSGATPRPPGEIRVPKLVLHGPKIRSAQVQTAYAAAHCRSVRCQGFAGLVVDANSVEEVERPARGRTEWEDRPHPGPLRLRRRFDRHWAARSADTKHHGRSPEPIRALAARCSRAHQVGWLEPSGGPSAVRSRPDVLSLARAHGVKGGRSRLGSGARRRRRFDAFSASSASCTRGTAAWCAHRHHRPPRRPLTTEVLEAEHAPWPGEGAVVGCAARRVAKRAAPRRRGRRQ